MEMKWLWCKNVFLIQQIAPNFGCSMFSIFYFFYLLVGCVHPFADQHCKVFVVVFFVWQRFCGVKYQRIFNLEQTAYCSYAVQLVPPPAYNLSVLENSGDCLFVCQGVLRLLVEEVIRISYLILIPSFYIIRFMLWNKTVS